MTSQTIPYPFARGESMCALMEVQCLVCIQKCSRVFRKKTTLETNQSTKTAIVIVSIYIYKCIISLPWFISLCGIKTHVLMAPQELISRLPTSCMLIFHYIPWSYSGDPVISLTNQSSFDIFKFDSWKFLFYVFIYLEQCHYIRKECCLG